MVAGRWTEFTKLNRFGFYSLTILAIVLANLAILRLAKKYLNEVDPSTRSGLSLNNNLVADNKKRK